MTPEVFVEMVAPHLPIGPYTGLRHSPGGGRSRLAYDACIHLSRSDGHGHHVDALDAANLLIGALVCEEGDLKKYDIGDGVRTFVARRTASDTPLCLCRSYSTDDTPIGILRALLAARAEAMKEAVNG